MLKRTFSAPGSEEGAEFPGIRIDLLVLLFFAAVAWIVYHAVIRNGFLSDDYDSLYRIVVEKRILYKEFLRPLIDISFYFNYFLSGLHPAGYYIFNLGVHVLSGFMVYKVTLRLPFFGGRQQFFFAWAAGLLFLVYPFHNESIVWLTGRLSSMAALCALLAIYFSLKKAGWGYFFLSAGFYTVGLFAYESIVMLPVIILVLNGPVYRAENRLSKMIAAWGCVLLFCLGLRIFITGMLNPDYGHRIVSGWGHGSYLGSLVNGLFKACGRSLLPPMEDSGRMTTLFLMVLSAIGFLHFILWNHRKAWRMFLDLYMRLGAVFFLSMIPPVVFGVSTRTSEGDRLLYFPSCFLCILVCSLIFLLIERKWRRWVVLGGLIAYSVVLVETNNLRWEKASEASEMILDTIRASPAKHIFLVNLPDELEGAFVFRNRFSRVLMLNKIDTGRVIVNNSLVRLQYLPVPGDIKIVRVGGWMFIYPDTRIIYPAGVVGGEPVLPGTRMFRIENLETGVIRVFDGKDDAVYYWDKSQLKRLILK